LIHLILIYILSFITLYTTELSKVAQWKNKKKRARRARSNTTASEEATITCSSCGRSDHKSARSPKCVNHTPLKAAVLKKKLGAEYTYFTKKIPLENWISTKYKSTFQRNVVLACSQVREVVYRAQLFVNHYLILHKNDATPNVVFTQNFWSSVFHLITNKETKVQAKHVPSDLLNTFRSFKNTHPGIVYRGNITTGVPQCWQHVIKIWLWRILNKEWWNTCTESFRINLWYVMLIFASFNFSKRLLTMV
jgi:hypothetical protein